jgi:hypothetical protein
MTRETLYSSTQPEQYSPSANSCSDNANLHSFSINLSENDPNSNPEQQIHNWKESISCRMKEAEHLLSMLEKEIDNCTGHALFGVIGLGRKLAWIDEHVVAIDDLLAEKLRDCNETDSAIGEIVKNHG